MTDTFRGRFNSNVTGNSTRQSDFSSIGELVETACCMEVMARKPGNVSPCYDFSDANVDDFLKSAGAIAPLFDEACRQTLGVTVLNTVQATRRVVNHNTNLGIILLIAPLAAVPRESSLRDGIIDVLNSTTVTDSRLVYQAIRIAQPSGLGKSAEQDLSEVPELNLLECMRLAADRDRIAAQYASGFDDVLNKGQEWLTEYSTKIESPSHRITALAVRLLSEFGDSLIARKCGVEMSMIVQKQAQQLLDNGWPFRQSMATEFDSFDAFLRADGNRRNPGTTADLVAAILFVALREGRMKLEGDWFRRKCT